MHGTEQPLFPVEEVSPEQVGADGSPYAFREFDRFFRSRDGWLGMEPNHDGPAREFFYDHSFAERDWMVDRGTGFQLLPMMVEFDAPGEALKSFTVVTARLPHFDGYCHVEVQIDIAARDADERIAELERQARETSAIELFKDILFDR